MYEISKNSTKGSRCIGRKGGKGKKRGREKGRKNEKTHTNKCMKLTKISEEGGKWREKEEGKKEQGVTATRGAKGGKGVEYEGKER